MLHEQTRRNQHEEPFAKSNDGTRAKDRAGKRFAQSSEAIGNQRQQNWHEAQQKPKCGSGQAARVFLRGQIRLDFWCNLAGDKRRQTPGSKQKNELRPGGRAAHPGQGNFPALFHVAHEVGDNFRLTAHDTPSCLVVRPALARKLLGNKGRLRPN